MRACGWSDAHAAFQTVLRATSSLIDLGELLADRLVLDDAAAALDAQLRVIERGLVGGAAGGEGKGRKLRSATPVSADRRTGAW